MITNAKHLLSKPLRVRYVYQISFALLSSIVELSTLFVVFKYFELLTSEKNASDIVTISLFATSFQLSKFTLNVSVLSYLLFGLTLRIINQLRLHSLTKATEDELSSTFYKRFFSKKFSWHKENHSANMVKSVMQDANLITSGYFIAAVNILTNSMVIIGLIVIFLFINFIVSLSALCVAILIYFSLFRATERKLKNYGKEKASAAASRYKYLSESVDAIHEIYVDHRLDEYEKGFSVFTQKYTDSHRGFLLIANIPTLMIESVSLLIITIFGTFVVNGNSNPEDVAQLMFSIVCATRLLPAANRVFQAKSVFTFSSVLVDQNLEKEGGISPKGGEKVRLREKISFEKVVYQIGTEEIIPPTTFEIRKGSRTLIKGKSGSGKSTIVELICGLLLPSDGKILIDNQELKRSLVKLWQGGISYLPQRCHLKDESIIDNVKLGLDFVDEDLLKRIIKLVGLSDIPGGLDRVCGEDGATVSGGQRQRISIARALLAKQNIIIMDEATNSLDASSEIELLREVFSEGKDTTFICVSHRTDIDYLFDQIINLENLRTI